LPMAKRAAIEVLCLPIYPVLLFNDVEGICNFIVPK
jgi:hypothetical protein